ICCLAYANCSASFERFLTVSQSSWSSFKLLPQEGISSRSFLRYSSDLALSGKQRFKRLIMIGTDVDAPGDAPSKAAIEPSALDTTSVPNSNAPVFRIFLNNLYPLSGNFDFPILQLCRRNKLLQGIQFIRRTFHHFGDEVFRQI